MGNIGATGNGLASIDHSDRCEREAKIFAALRADAARFTDSFADIAALLFELAHYRTLSLENVHGLATLLDAHGDTSTFAREVVERVADARRLIAAHLIFKALSEQEHDVRALFDLQAQPPSNRNERSAKVAS